jgi:hypothetical protein
MHEISSIAERCRDCGTATVFAIVFYDNDESGQDRGGIRRERVEHGRQECARMQSLAREEWPTLW